MNHTEKTTSEIRYELTKLLKSFRLAPETGEGKVILVWQGNSISHIEQRTFIK